jgi:hypothetical protein
MNHATTSIGGLAFLYSTRRARWYLTGIGSLKELMTILRLASAQGRPVRLRGPGTNGSGSRRPRSAR